MTQITILPQLGDRWSPRVFKDVQIGEQQMKTLIEAARWAPSSRNSQPWRFIYASKKDTENWGKLLDCLVDSNKAWARYASHLLLACVVKIDPATNRPRKHAWYDLGLAMANLTFQANSMGIFVRNMGGFEVEKAVVNFSIPETIEPVVMMALGYPDETIKKHPEFDVPLKENRKREELGKLIYTGSWEEMNW